MRRLECGSMYASPRADTQNVWGRARVPGHCRPLVAELGGKRRGMLFEPRSVSRWLVMTTLFTTRTSLGRTDDERRGRSVVLPVFVVLAAIILIGVAAAVGLAPTIVGAVGAVALLIAALTFVWALRAR